MQRDLAIFIRALRHRSSQCLAVKCQDTLPATSKYLQVEYKNASILRFSGIWYFFQIFKITILNASKLHSKFLSIFLYRRSQTDTQSACMARQDSSLCPPFPRSHYLSVEYGLLGTSESSDCKVSCRFVKIKKYLRIF
jgi:hypothetical protein